MNLQIKLGFHCRIQIFLIISFETKLNFCWRDKYKKYQLLVLFIDGFKLGCEVLLFYGLELIKNPWKLLASPIWLCIKWNVLTKQYGPL